MPDSYHKQLRAAVAEALGNALEAASITLAVVEQNGPNDPTPPALPSVVVSWGPAESSQYATNFRDDVSYPLLVSLLTVDAAADPPGCEQTRFREVVRAKFHHKRLAGFPDVLWCLVEPFSPPVEATPAMFQNVRSVLVVTPVARRPR